MLHGLKKKAKQVLSRFNITLFRGRVLPVTMRHWRQVCYFHDLFEMIRGVRGDVIECGVGRGRSFTNLAFFCSSKEYGPRRLFGFDSFRGFPKPHEKDNAGGRNAQAGEWAYLEPRDLVAILGSANIPEEFIRQNVTIVPGFVNETLPGYRGRIALLHIDLDLYEAYKDTLWSLYDAVEDGGIIAFDEYRNKTWPGATEAIHEFFAERRLEVDDIQYHSIGDRFYFIKPRSMRESAQAA